MQEEKLVITKPAEPTTLESQRPPNWQADIELRQLKQQSTDNSKAKELLSLMSEDRIPFARR